MAKVYLSFLGTTDYLPCTYFREDVGDTENVRFIQEAMISLFCSDWTQEDRIRIFTTDTAESKNWNDNGHVRRYTSECQGLKRCIEKLNLDIDVQKIAIPQGKDENEIWETFQIIYDSIQKDDEVIFDVTHAFRSIPMLAIVVLNYAKALKGINLKGIYYGAFETLGNPAEVGNIPLERRRVPILDLTPFDQLMDWTAGIDRYVKTGNPELVKELAVKGVNPILKQTKGMDEGACAIKNISNRLNDFVDVLSTCRGPKIAKTAEILKQKVNRTNDLGVLPPFIPLFNKLKQQVAVYSGDPVMDGIAAAKWCVDHNMIQQSYTILQETLISHFLIMVDEDPKAYTNRTVASQSVAIFNRKLSDKYWKQPAANNKKLVEKLIRLFTATPKLAEEMRNLTKYRNDLNHAGYVQSPMPPIKFKKTMLVMLDRLMGMLGNHVAISSGPNI